MATGCTWAQVAQNKPAPVLPTECNIANFLYDWSENSAILLVDNNKYNNTE